MLPKCRKCSVNLSSDNWKGWAKEQGWRMCILCVRVYEANIKRKNYNYEKIKRYRQRHPEKVKEWQAKAKRKLKITVLTHYSHDTMACVGWNGNCPFHVDPQHYSMEVLLKVLSIDHINGGGHQHRKMIGTNLYNWLIHNNYPEEFQVLCLNCQFLKR